MRVRSKSISSKIYRHPTPEAIVESAFGHIRILEDLISPDLKVSLKASDVLTTVAAYRCFRKVRLPFTHRHFRSRDAFLRRRQVERGLGILLAGVSADTLRVSLTADPVDEVRAAYEILKSLKLRQRG